MVLSLSDTDVEGSWKSIISLPFSKKKKKSFLKGSKQVVLEGECGYSTRLPTMGVSCV